MPLPPKLIISTDFDGTLTSPAAPDILSPGFMQWLQEARGKSSVIWIINTGRSWESLSAELDRRKAAIWPDWVVLVEREIFRIHERSPISPDTWNERCDEIHAELFKKTADLWGKMRGEFRRFENLQMVKDIGCPLGFIADSEEQGDELEQCVLEMISGHPDLMLVPPVISVARTIPPAGSSGRSWRKKVTFQNWPTAKEWSTVSDIILTKKRGGPKRPPSLLNIQLEALNFSPEKYRSRGRLF